jgi:pimeloyl-ACP methyl ester carboxylesterase
MDLVYERRGAGEPLVLLHGIGHHWRAWLPVMDRLAAAHDVIAIDLPGFGESPLPSGGNPSDMPGLVAAIGEFLTGLGVHRPHVAGNSLGGAIALELAANGMVSSATALSPAGFYTQWQRRWAIGLLSTQRLAAHAPLPVLRFVANTSVLRTVCFRSLVARPELITAEVALRDTIALRDAKAFAAVARAGRAYRVSACTPTVPVTVAWGTRDRVLSYRQAAVARQVLPLARHVDLLDCGHVPMTDDPEQVASVILATTMLASAHPPPLKPL